MSPRLSSRAGLLVLLPPPPQTTSDVQTGVENHALVLFDGVCNLCNGAVNFIIDGDPEGYVRFAPLQPDVAERMMERRDGADAVLDTIMLVDNDEVFVRSTAALRVAQHLSGLWPLLYAAIAVPRPIHDAVYDWIANHRYRWFRKREQCRVPATALQDRLLEYAPH